MIQERKLKKDLRQDAQIIINESINAVLPNEAVKSALFGRTFSNDVILVSIGKAAWTMAKEASDTLKEKIKSGIVITKYGHSKGKIANFEIYEADHPVPDENSFKATKRALEMVSNLKKEDTVLFLISGGGSSLFEEPLISEKELQKVTNDLLSCGADITEINTIRKRLSKVKGGKFAVSCLPAKVYAVVLSDILGDPLDMIASGPATEDKSTCQDALDIVKKYDLKFSQEVLKLLKTETPKHIYNVETVVTGSVKFLCKAAKESAEKLGYDAQILADDICCEARNAGKMLAKKANEYTNCINPKALIIGGETVVHITGKGKGGRNQEIALAMAEEIEGLDNIIGFSVGSDGTDGPTDAAGGIVNGQTKKELLKYGIGIKEVLSNNDSYNALKKVDGLIFTGPTGTNVNDVSVVLINSK